MRSSTIFKNRWWALIWAAGILLFAYDVAGGQPSAGDGNNAVATDDSGAPVTADDQKALAGAIANM